MTPTFFLMLSFIRDSYSLYTSLCICFQILLTVLLDICFSASIQQRGVNWESSQLFMPSQDGYQKSFLSSKFNHYDAHIFFSFFPSKVSLTKMSSIQMLIFTRRSKPQYSYQFGSSLIFD